MLGIFLLYFIGKRFAELSEEFNKTKWHYVVLGIIIYYVGAIGIGMILFGILDGLSIINLDAIHDRVLDLMILPLGILSCYLFYNYLKKKWEKEAPKLNKMINEIGEDTESID